jgi:hypothetical protein
MRAITGNYSQHRYDSCNRKFTVYRFTVQRSFRAYKQPTKEKTEIRKVIACENSVGTFALISEAGDVYLFNTEEPQALRKETGKDGGTRRPVPHLIWGVRRQFTAVKVWLSFNFYC